ncbi:hypothetical protein FPQ18DRAFT_383736 [Pyronema domesticum]|nr:hypothetical protein FPQ18DRAFT_383736 [Pyronema domesticum]
MTLDASTGQALMIIMILTTQRLHAILTDNDSEEEEQEPLLDMDWHSEEDAEEDYSLPTIKLRSLMGIEDSDSGEEEDYHLFASSFYDTESSENLSASETSEDDDDFASMRSSFTSIASINGDDEETLVSSGNDTEYDDYDSDSDSMSMMSFSSEDSEETLVNDDMDEDMDDDIGDEDYRLGFGV